MPVATCSKCGSGMKLAADYDSMQIFTCRCPGETTWLKCEFCAVAAPSVVNVIDDYDEEGQPGYCRCCPGCI